MVSTTGIAVSSKTELRFPVTGPGGHGRQIIHSTSYTYSIYGIAEDNPNNYEKLFSGNL